jgi:hypothetical protein
MIYRPHRRLQQWPMQCWQKPIPLVLEDHG